MRLATIPEDGGRTPCLVRGERVIRLRDLRLSRPASIDEIVEGGGRGLEEIARAVSHAPDESEAPWSDLPAVLESPILPRIIICGGANFRDHLDETRRERPSHVEFFLKPQASVVGHGHSVIFDGRMSKKYDYEVELGIVIGKEASNVPAERALEHVAAYTIVNDISLRDQQVIRWEGSVFQLRFGQGKCFDTSAPVGPWLVTPDELGAPGNLQLQTYVNGVMRQNNNTSNLLWAVEELVSYYSSQITLYPGMLIASGTPGGPALGADSELGADPYERDDVPRLGYMQPGDKVECRIERIGSLINTISAEGS